MRQDKKVHFVCFETTLDKNQFIKRWEQFKRSANSDADVTLQQSETDGLFTYIAQHRFDGSESQFIFSKEGRTSRIPQERIKTTHAGGYSILHADKLAHDPRNRKIFIFLTDATTDLKVYKDLSPRCKLNIYQAYYQNCKYAYILEYFIDNKHVAELQDLLTMHNNDMKVYKEFIFVKSGVKREDEVYVWPK